MFSVISGPNDHFLSISSFGCRHYLIELMERFIKTRSIVQKKSIWNNVPEKVQNVLMNVLIDIWTQWTFSVHYFKGFHALAHRTDRTLYSDNIYRSKGVYLEHYTWQSMKCSNGCFKSYLDPMIIFRPVVYLVSFTIS